MSGYQVLRDRLHKSGVASVRVRTTVACTTNYDDPYLTVFYANCPITSASVSLGSQDTVNAITASVLITAGGAAVWMDKSFDHLSEAAKSGLARLLLKLPAFQRTILIASTKEQRRFDEMLAAYEEACLALERFRRESRAEVALIDEYKTLCDELEGDVMREVRPARD